eukprot:TRINITY_DN1220_c3_g1_i1.p1 TRINITY_DN1220_c3_g1~~TRINITY_DN1220_c3_g1_i1.p1  ORF type:complete len:124 (+),score=16.12 TRINITY_DN1220_c3_g1_i1:60-431(+)
MGHENWPWPNAQAVPRGTKWWKSLTPGMSIAKRVRRVELIGDCVILGAIGYLFAKAYLQSDSAYQHKRSALIGQPPALVAQYYNFASVGENRTVGRDQLQKYKDELAGARKSGSSGSDIAFKY